MKTSIIVAIDENNAIGFKNKLLCYLPNDLKHFKKITEHNTVVMGRKTFESLPNGALPNRTNIVLTKNRCLSYDGCLMCYSIDDIWELCKNDNEIFFIGGANVYKSIFNKADNLYVTHINHKFPLADSFFPKIETSDWNLVEEIDNKSDEKNLYNHSFCKYERKKL